jgi:hypothetical protein
LAATGRFLDAAHCLHLACIQALVERGVVELSRSEPNRTLRRRVRASTLAGADAELWCALLDRTETAWFRSRSDEPDLYESWLSLHDRLLALPAR